MRPGGGQAKGGSFERFVSKALSRWCSAGHREDLFWRTAGSGALGTTKGVKNQLGDIGAISTEGASLTAACILECKCYKSLDWSAFVFERKGTLDRFWLDLQLICLQHTRTPFMILKENRRPTVAMLPAKAINRQHVQPLCTLYRSASEPVLVVLTLDELVKHPYIEFTQRANALAKELYASAPNKRPAPHSTPRARLPPGIP